MNKWLAYGLIGVGAYLLLRKTGAIKGFGACDCSDSMGGYDDAFAMGDLGWIPGTIPTSPADWGEARAAGATPYPGNPNPYPTTGGPEYTTLMNAWLNWEYKNNPYFKPGAPTPPNWSSTRTPPPDTTGGGGGGVRPPPSELPWWYGMTEKERAKAEKKMAMIAAKRRKAMLSPKCWVYSDHFQMPVNKCMRTIDWSEVQMEGAQVYIPIDRMKHIKF